MMQNNNKKHPKFYQIFYDFACSGFDNFAKINPEMKKILFFVLGALISLISAEGATRTTNSPNRGGKTVSTQRALTSRATAKTTQSVRTSKPVSVLSSTQHKTVTTRTPATRSASNHTAATTRNMVSRAATNDAQTTETRTGAAYEQCKTAFFTCMDQFCQLKNDSFRRCSCSDRIFDFQDISETYQSASEKLTEFSENLDVVGMTREQAMSMKTATEGENALTEDKSASKQLLQAIMNSIKGEKTSVGGKYQDLNSISISADMSNAFGMDDSGQIIASYNGEALYKAVYPKCRTAVKEDCNNASLQRAINAYLMAIEQDCNTVETALQSQRKTLKAATHQSSAMLDLARVENRQKHNADDISTCLVNVENAIQSEEVCGEGYYRCLDYGEYIDITTGAPFAGVKDFYKLGEILTFKNTDNLKDAKLSQLNSNRKFAQYFENKTKKFAKDSLDRCIEQSDTVWQEYLDRALLDIYYAQQSKVQEIQQSCVDLVTACYNEQSTSIATAMAALTGDSAILLQPAAVQLTNEMCGEYINSCNNMFGDISKTLITDYVQKKTDTDSEAACRAVAQQCFSKFGGTGYENFYALQSGLFTPGEAIDWFSLYKYNGDTQEVDENGDPVIVSPCAKELLATTGCKDSKLLERVFGGFDKHIDSTGNIVYTYDISSDRRLRANGVASETYLNIIDNLSTQCETINGYFVEHQYIEQYGYNPHKACRINSTDPKNIFYINTTYVSDSTLDYWYHFLFEENMCPADYEATKDVQSWGMCSCWENGGYRSKNGTTKTCMQVIPVIKNDSENDMVCNATILNEDNNATFTPERYNYNISWCQQSLVSSTGQLCPTAYVAIREDNVICTRDKQVSITSKIIKDIGITNSEPSYIRNSNRIEKTRSIKIPLSDGKGSVIVKMTPNGSPKNPNSCSCELDKIIYQDNEFYSSNQINAWIEDTRGCPNKCKPSKEIFEARIDQFFGDVNNELKSEKTSPIPVVQELVPQHNVDNLEE